MHDDTPSRIALTRFGREVRVPCVLPVELGPGRQSPRLERVPHRSRQVATADMLQQMPETLHDRPLHPHRKGGKLLRVDLPSEVG